MLGLAPINQFIPEQGVHYQAAFEQAMRHQGTLYQSLVVAQAVFNQAAVHSLVVHAPTAYLHAAENLAVSDEMSRIEELENIIAYGEQAKLTEESLMAIIINNYFQDLQSRAPHELIARAYLQVFHDLEFAGPLASGTAPFLALQAQTTHLFHDYWQAFFIPPSLVLS